MVREEEQEEEEEEEEEEEQEEEEEEEGGGGRCYRLGTSLSTRTASRRPRTMLSMTWQTATPR